MINRIIIDTPYPPPRQVFSPGLATTEAQVHTTHILDSALETLIEHCLLINKNLLEICLFNVKFYKTYGEITDIIIYYSCISLLFTEKKRSICPFCLCAVNASISITDDEKSKTL